jgi:uncharacterized protein YndB with AHSA1/START domain
MTGDTGTHEVVATRVFDAPVERVWNAWREPDAVRQWWGPEGFTSPLARMDFRVGGTSLVCMRAPAEFGGADMYNTWTYSQIVPHRLIEFVLRFSDPEGRAIDPAQAGLPPGVPAEVRHVVTFQPLDGGRTAMTVTEYGYPSAEARDLSLAGLEQCLDKMARSLASSRTAGSSDTVHSP